MKVLISGCSFTQWPDAPGGRNICWPKYLGDLDSNLEITTVAEAAAGNQYICDSIIREVCSKPAGYYDHVLVMWSGVSRLDYLTSLEDPAWDKLFDSYGFYRRLPDNNLGYIFSGGQYGTWFANNVAKTMFKEMYKVSSERSLAHINLMEMVKLQGFLRSKNIPYHFMSYVNYWNRQDQVGRNGDFGVYKYPDLDFLINDLDFDHWIFRNENRDGIFELAKEINSLEKDQFHPASEANRIWAELVYKRVSESRT